MTAWAQLIDAAWARFVAKVDATDPNGCWLWRGAKTRGKGNRAWYGQFHVGTLAGRAVKVKAHIFAAAAVGEYQPGQHRDHYACANTLCVNPWHGETVSPTENTRRRWSAHGGKVSSARRPSLREMLPAVVLDCGSFEGRPFMRHLSQPVVEQYGHDGAPKRPWPGKERHVRYWWLLANGIAVGWNDSPQAGWAFPIRRLTTPRRRRRGQLGAAPRQHQSEGTTAHG